jgi:hypothetical protein
VRYEIRLQGTAERIVASAFDELEVTAERGNTVLRGEIPDQAALHGVLARIQRLGLVLLDLRADSAPNGTTA